MLFIQMKHHFSLLFCATLLLVATLALSGAVVPKSSQTLDLSSGWNAIVLEGTPLFRGDFLKLHPFAYDAAANGYVQCDEETVLLRGTAVWIYCETVPDSPVKIALKTASTETAEPVPEKDGWAFLGAASDLPSWSQGAAILFQWSFEKGFNRVAAPQAGHGYWVNYTVK